MNIRYGFDIGIELPQDTPIVTLMDVHPDRRSDVLHEDAFVTEPARPVETFVDMFGNLARRFLAPAGPLTMRLDGVLQYSGEPDRQAPGAAALPVAALPANVLPFLLGSRYCETDLLTAFAWERFGTLPKGWGQVQAVCDFVHGHLVFDYAQARATRTAAEALREQTGVCRDFTHLAVSLCRCLNIPARYCNGYLGDIGVAPDPSPMDFNAWFEVYLDGAWHTFDARHNTPRIGRILLARGRDAADIPMFTSYGPHTLQRFVVVTEEVPAEPGIRAVA